MSSKKLEVGFVDNAFYDSKEKYVMGYDCYNGKDAAACVMKVSNGTIAYIGRGKKEDFEKEVKTIAEYFHIPESMIIKES